MARETVIVDIEARRQKALGWLAKAPLGFVVTFQRNKRSIPQNARLWAMLGEISRQVEWHGAKLSPDDWKIIFLQALGHEMRIAPNIAGDGIVSLGGRSSKLSKQEFSDLMELMSAFAAERGVIIEERVNE
jgi:hypothetical protein